MIHYHSEVFTTKISGQRVASVTCEKCGTPYYYELSRIGIGKASSPYSLFERAAARRAEARAERDLEKQLDRDAELVPCPKCHWVNQDLIDRYRRWRYRVSPGLVIGVMIAAFFILLVAEGVVRHLNSEGRAPVGAPVFMLGMWLLSPVWILLIRRSLRRRINPNQSYPRLPALPRGTPAALVERQDKDTGESYLEPAASLSESAGQHGDWAMLRLAQAQFPPVCCACLETPSGIYRSPIQFIENREIEVPICTTCLHRLRMRWWLVAAMMAVLACGATALFVWTYPGDTNGSPWLLFVILAPLGTLVGVALVPNWLCRPYRIRIIDAHRGIGELSAKNPDYTKLFSKWTSERES
jgi:hypothetical protein